MTFTKSQMEAIQYRGGSILVSAGAGSGKTRVLTERLINYLLTPGTDHVPASLNRFLIITFTRAAAAELRSRISDAISSEISRNPDNQFLRRQMMLCRDAQIETIDAFCQKILRRYADQLGISPTFRVLDAEKSSRLRHTALDRILEQEYQNGERSFLHLADRLGAGRDDARLAETVLRLHGEMQSHARPEQWIHSCLEEMHKKTVSVLDTGWGKELAETANKKAVFWGDELEAAIERMKEDPVLLNAFYDSYSETLTAIRRLSGLLEKDWDAAVNSLPIPFPRVVTPKKCSESILAKACKDTRDACRKEMKRLAERLLNNSSDNMLEDYHATIPDMTTLLALCMKLEKAFQAAKRKANGLDFSDMEHFCLRLLTDESGEQTDIGREISEEYEEIMVDEYQDVSRVQDAIFHAISRDGKNLFLVGDVKQAIYRFRLADPAIFREKSCRYGEPENTRGERLIHLQENFRSSQEVVEGVNDVFARVMSAELGDLDYTREEALIHGSEQSEKYEKPHLLLLAREETEREEESESDAAGSSRVPAKVLRNRRSSAEAEADLVAGKIRQLVQNGIVHDVKGHPRRIEYRDIAILLRAANTEGKTFAARLAYHGIPAEFGAGGSFFKSIEVSIVLSMIKLIDNPHRDIPLLTILRSPAFSCDEDILSAIRAERIHSDYYSAVLLSQDPKALRFLTILRELRRDALELDPSQLVSRIINRLNLYALCNAMPDPDSRLQNLAGIQNLAAEFQKTGEKGVHRFLRWLSFREEQGIEPQFGAGNGNSVKILSVHKSKGLEFPVVFYSRLGKPFNVRDTKEAILLHPTLGIGAKYIDAEQKIEYPTGAHAAIAQKLKIETKSEELRLLYVAMTRAKEKLFLTACLRKPEERLEKARRMSSCIRVPPEYAASAEMPVEWLLPAAADGTALLTEIIYEAGDLSEETQYREGNDLIKNEKLLKSLDDAMQYHYPWADAENTPSKLTATELKSRESFYPDPDAAPLLPNTLSRTLRNPDLDADSMTAAEAGTLVHLLMQQIDLAKTGSVSDIQKEVERLLQQKYLTSAEAESIDLETVFHFFRSDIGRRVLAAKTCRREFRFSVLVEASEVLGVCLTGDEILLQGSIDCYFEEENPKGYRELVVIDYKTDHVYSDEEIKKRAEHYRVQLQTYAAVLSKITGMCVKEKILYFLIPGKSVSI